MNCDEVIRELAVPSDDRDPAALAEHLSKCRDCAEWAERANRLDRLWDLTRPLDPASEVWDSLWARVTAALDAPTTAPAKGAFLPVAHSQNGAPVKIDGSQPRQLRPRAGRWWKTGALIVLAQAAAVLIAVLLTWRSPAKPLPVEAKSEIELASTTVNLEIEEGHLVVIQWDGLSGKVEDRTPDISDGVDDWLLGLNAVEALADLSVALKE